MTTSGPRTPASARARLPVKKRQYVRREARQRQIIEAAREVFARSGLQGARTRELARAAGVNQATLFEHYESKEHLFEAAVVQPLLELLRGARDRMRVYQTATSEEETVALIQAALELHLNAMVEIFPLLAVSLFSDPEAGRKLYNEQFVPILKLRGESVKAVVREPISPDLVALTTFGMIFAVAMNQAFTSEAIDIGATARQIALMQVHGFATEPLPE